MSVGERAGRLVAGRRRVLLGLKADRIAPRSKHLHVDVDALILFTLVALRVSWRVAGWTLG